MDPITLGLPHRSPFLFLDEVTELEAGKRASALKVFSPQEPFFAGHFPGNPIVPGVILTEALAQTAGIAAGEPGKSYLLSAVKMMKFPRAVRPGEPIVLRAEKSAEIGGLLQFSVSARVGEEIVAEGTLVLNEARPSA